MAPTNLSKMCWSAVQVWLANSFLHGKGGIPPIAQFIIMPPSATTHLDEGTQHLASETPSFTRENLKRAHHYVCLLKTVTSCIQGRWIGVSVLVVDRIKQITLTGLSGWNWTERTREPSLGRNLIALWGAHSKCRCPPVCPWGNGTVRLWDFQEDRDCNDDREPAAIMVEGAEHSLLPWTVYKASRIWFSYQPCGRGVVPIL